MIRILFVCTGNMCRSPMAEGIMRGICVRDREGGREISSAGTWACVGEPPPQEAIQVCRENGVDISCHRARQLTEEMVRGSDHVLVMENAHLRKIIEEVPEAEAKVRMLGGFLHREDGDDDEEIQDPYGGSASEYRDCFARLRGHVAAFAETLRRA